MSKNKLFKTTCTQLRNKKTTHLVFEDTKSLHQINNYVRSFFHYKPPPFSSNKNFTNEWSLRLRVPACRLAGLREIGLNIKTNFVLPRVLVSLWQKHA